METEDYKLKKLFNDFNPDLESDFRFMERLQRNLDSVELVCRRNMEQRARCRKAVAIAAVCGFVCGILCTFAMPYIVAAFSRLEAVLPSFGSANSLGAACYIAALLVAGVMSAWVAVSAYELSLALLKR